jgi:ADP-ribose pyrophosphatase
VNDQFPRVLGTERTPFSPWLEVISREVQFRPDGDVETYYAIAEPHYVIAVAVTPEQRILLVRQYRPAIQRFSLELPAGRLEKNEDPADAMARELQEETGYATRSITRVGLAASNASRIDNATYSFFIRTGQRSPDFIEEPGVSVSSASSSELKSLILSGELSEQTHLGTLALAQWAGLVSL